MKAQLYLGTVLLFSLLLTGGQVYAQTNTAANWQASYWDNVTFAGAPVVTRSESQINYNWGAGSPVPGRIPPERFAARWTSTLPLPAGRYRFTVTVDDGARLWVNDQLLIDEWAVQSRQAFQADVTVTGNALPVRLDYFENTGQAAIQLAWTRLDQPPQTGNAVGAPLNVWRGEYFTNVTLSGLPTLVRNDEELAFNWGTRGPAEQIGAERFAVRWTRTLSLSPGRYQFAATVDDGVRLWVAGQPVLDDWRVHSVRTLRAEVMIVGGATPVQMEYFENTGAAVARLTWTQLAPQDDAVSPVDGQTATVARASHLNLRRGPGVGFAQVRVLDRGDVVDMIGRNNAATWIQIRLADGQTGWVNAFYLNNAAPLSLLPVVP